MAKSRLAHDENADPAQVVGIGYTEDIAVGEESVVIGTDNNDNIVRISAIEESRIGIAPSGTVPSVGTHMPAGSVEYLKAYENDVVIVKSGTVNVTKTK